MTFSQVVFLSLLYQTRELYTADYSLSDEAWIQLGLVALAVILIVAFFQWTRRRNRSLARSEQVTDEADKAGKAKKGREK